MKHSDNQSKSCLNDKSVIAIRLRMVKNPHGYMLLAKINDTPYFSRRCIVDYLTYSESFSSIGREFVEKNANIFHALLQQ